MLVNCVMALVLLGVVKTSTPPFRSVCNDQCSQSVSASGLSKLWNRTCFCDQCELYDDCCADRRAPVRPTAATCGLKLMDNNYIYSVSKCLLTSVSDELQQKCQNRSNTVYEKLPVYSQQSKLVFKNIYCAMCSQQDLDLGKVQLFDLHAFDYKGHTWWNKSGEVNTENIEKYFLESDNLNDGVRVGIALPSGLSDARECLPSIDQCPEGSDQDLKRLCSASTAYRFDIRRRIVYKNKHCAKCNGVDERYLSCKVNPSSPSAIPIHSLKLLFDLSISETQVTIKIFTKDENRTQVSLQSACNREQGSCLTEELENLADDVCKIADTDNTTAFIRAVKAYTTIIGQTISIASLAVLLSIYGANKALRNEPGKILMNLAGSLMLSQVSFMVATYLAEPTVSVLFQGRCENRFGSVGALLSRLADSAPLSGCFVGGLLTHYFYLSFFAWSHVTAFDLQRTLGAMRAGSGPGQSSRRLTRYALFAWLAPALVVAALLLSQLSTRRLAYAYRHCFISHPVDHKLAFVLPVALVLLANSVLLALAIRSVRAVDALSRRFLSGEHSRRALLRSTGSSTQESSLTTEGAAATTPSARANQGRTPPADPSAEKQRLVLFLKLFLLTGMTWMLGLLSSLTDSSLVWIVYILLNSLQGLFILLSFALSPQTQQHIRNSSVFSRISFLFASSN
nr:G protein-coupled receptor [Proales similis]